MGEDRKIRLEIVSEFPPGTAVEVAVVMSPRDPKNETKWADLMGLGAEIWEGVDAQEYINVLRSGGDLDALFKRARENKKP